MLSHLQEMTSDKIHEQSWPQWDSANLRLILAALKGVLNEVYVLPKERLEQAKMIEQLRHQVSGSKVVPEGPDLSAV